MMSRMSELTIESGFTYLYPMRQDDPVMADFDRRREEVIDIMGVGYPKAMITRIGTILSSNGLRHSTQGIILHDAYYEDGQMGCAKAITFESGLTVDKIVKAGQRVGPLAAIALLEFALELQGRLEAGQAPERPAPTSIN